MARARVAGAEAARVAGVEVRLLRRDAGAFGVGDARGRPRAPPPRTRAASAIAASASIAQGWKRSRSRAAAARVGEVVVVGQAGGADPRR